MSPRYSTLAVLGLSAALLGACDGPTGAKAPVEITLGSAEIVVERGQQAQIEVTVANTSNQAVTYTSSNTSIASVSAGGVVQGVEVGNATVRVTSVQDTSKWVRATVRVTRPPVASVQLQPVAAELFVGQTAQLAATARDASNGVLGDEVLLWRSSAPEVVSVSAAGFARALASGTARITVMAQSDTTRRAFVDIGARVDPDAASIASISPATLTPGATMVIEGANFAATPGENQVRIGGVSMLVMAASATQLTVQLPAGSAFPCLPTGPAEVRVDAGHRSATRQHPVAVATPHTLGVGESVSFLNASAARCNELAGTGGRYVVNVHNASTAGGSASPFQLYGGPTVQPAFAMLQPTRALARTLTPEMRLQQLAEEQHHRILEKNREILQREAPRLPAPQRAARQMNLNPPPAVGTILPFRVPDINNFNCQNHIAVGARVVYVGARSVILEDTLAPLRGQMDAQFAQIGAEFDGPMWNVLTTYFGNPLAMDAQLNNDGRVYMLFSESVNNFGGVAGFVTSCDFFPRAQLGASDEAEIFYATVPTVAGSGFETGKADNWVWQMRSTIIHEVKHITSYAERLARSRTAWEESWLEESTARVSEEIWARSIFGYAQGQNVAYAQSLYCEARPSWSECSGKPVVMRKHFGGLYNYLQNVEAYTPLGNFGGGGSSFYGSGWSLVRWAIDHSGRNEAEFIRSLTQEPNLSGMTNLSTKAGKSPERIIADWTAAIALDDWPGATVNRPELRMPSWNLRNVVAGMNGDFPNSFTSPWPLPVRQLQYGGFTADVASLRAGTAATFELSGTQTRPQLVALRGQGGGDAAPTLGMTITRIQ
jgi:uncharacterized protein (TIGR03437 family)